MILIGSFGVCKVGIFFYKKPNVQKRINNKTTAAVQKKQQSLNKEEKVLKP